MISISDWSDVDWLLIWKSDLSDEIKLNFFQAAILSIIQHGCTIWTLTKRREKKLDENCTRMLRAILNKSWKIHPTKQQLEKHPNKKNLCRTQLVKEGRTHKRDSPMDLFTRNMQCVGRPTRTYLQQLFTDTGCNLEDLPEAMDDRDEWQERIRVIRATRHDDDDDDDDDLKQKYLTNKYYCYSHISMGSIANWL